MAGFGNSIMYAKNMNFDELGPKPILGIINAAGKLPIGTGNLSPTPEILGGSITSPDSSLTVGYSSPNITLQVTGGTSTIKTITGNDSVPESPVAGNFNFLTANSTVRFLGTAATETLDFGLSNLILGNNGSTITIGTGNVGVGNGLYGSLSSGSSNTFVGTDVAGPMKLSTGGQNCGFGQNALAQIVSGTNNNAFGYQAGSLYTLADSGNIVINHSGVPGESNTIRIGTPGGGASNQTRAFVAGITGVTVAASAPIAVDTHGQISSLGFGTANQVLTSNGAGTSPTFQAVSASGAITTITGSSGGAQSPSAGNFNILGTGSITSVGTANTETIQLTGLTNHTVLVGAGTATITKVGPGSSGQILQSGGASADPAYSTATYPSTAGTSGKVLISDGTNIVSSTPTFPNASATSGKFIRSDGTNWIASTPTLPTTAGTSGKILQSNGTNYVESTPTYPSTSGSSGKIIISDGTNNIYSTPTFPNSAGTSGNVLTSNGTNFVSSTPPTTASNASVYVNSTISNATGDGTFVTPVIFDTEFFDLGNNYDTATGLFTIPTTGKYLVCVGITFTGLLVAHTSAEVRIVANGGTVTRNQFNPFVASVSGQFTYCQSLVISGTAAQTINIVAAVSGGTKVVGFLGASFGEYCVASFTFLG
jgi:hypothetical protein